MSQPSETHSPVARSTLTTDIAIEHILLSYLYLDKGDTEGYASLLDRAAHFEEPGHPTAHGPEASAALLLGRYGERGTHRPDRVIASGENIVVIGDLTPRKNEMRKHEFADVFAFNEHGLLASWRRFHAPAR